MTPLDVANVMGSDESAELLKEMMVIHYIIILNDLIIVVYARALNLLALKWVTTQFKMNESTIVMSEMCLY